MRLCTVLLLMLASLAATGCTTLREFVANGFKLGPNFSPPPAPVAPQWVHAQDPRVRSDLNSLCAWWQHFEDPQLDALIQTAYAQNLGLRRAAERILEARYERNKKCSGLLPQAQLNIGNYAHGQISKTLTQGALPQIFDAWSDGMALSWEFDFWGSYRRDIESANADLDSYTEAYHDALVILLSDIASNYVRLRVAQQRLAYARQNVAIQQGTLADAQRKYEAGKAPEMDVHQARVNLTQTESTIPPLIANLWEANNQLCVLLGMPVQDMSGQLGEAPIPNAPPEVAVGIPADLLRRRPDVRQAERDVAARCAKIGVAEADLYPAISVAGFIGYSSDSFGGMFDTRSFTGFVVPAYYWKVLNYGKLYYNIRIEDSRFKQEVLKYQTKVLKAGEEVETALIGYLQAQQQANLLVESVEAADRYATLVMGQYKEGTIDFNRVFTAQEKLVSQQDRLATARQDVALNLIKVYRAMGGGWEAFPCLHDPQAVNPGIALPLTAPPEENLPPPSMLPPALPEGQAPLPRQQQVVPVVATQTVAPEEEQEQAAEPVGQPAAAEQADPAPQEEAMEPLTPPRLLPPIDEPVPEALPPASS